jgi:hypothetical protein
MGSSGKRGPEKRLLRKAPETDFPRFQKKAATEGK